MASTPDFIEYVMSQASGNWSVRSRKMFGEYMVYINEKPLLLICENTVYIKILPETTALLKDQPTGFPYEGAKNHYILDMDDRELVRSVLAVLEPITPLPKPKKRK